MVTKRAQQLVEEGVNGALGRLGVRMRRFSSEVFDLRGQTSDPVEANYLSETRRAVIDAPLEDCLILHASAFPCTRRYRNPFVETLIAYAEGRCRSYSGSPLQAFFDSWQPRTAAEVLGLDGSAVHPALRDGDPFGYVLPWDAKDPQEKRQEREDFIRRDHASAGKPLDAEFGWKSWGPCSPELGELEFARLVAVFRSIRKRGFSRADAPDGDIGAVVLRKNGRNRFLIAPGHHRAAALAALGESAAPVRLSAVIVRREEVSHWPGVRRGLFSEAGAIHVFDRIHAGVQPPAARDRP